MGAILIYLFIFGLFIGSFYNCVALRLCKNESIIHPGSHCLNCNHQLSWYELIPVFSYIGLKGKCKKCRIKISIQYPLVEILTGILFCLSFYLFGFTYNTLISIVLCSVVIITFITDIKYMVILDEVLIIGAILLGVIYYFEGGIVNLLSHIVGGLELFLILLIVKALGDKVFKQESLGWGDVKLSFIAGMVLGLKLGIVYIFLGAFLAFPYALVVTLRKKEGILPFGPFLVSSLLLIFWNYNNVLNLVNMLLGL